MHVNNAIWWVTEDETKKVLNVVVYSHISSFCWQLIMGFWKGGCFCVSSHKKKNIWGFPYQTGSTGTVRKLSKKALKMRSCGISPQQSADIIAAYWDNCSVRNAKAFSVCVCARVFKACLFSQWLYLQPLDSMYQLLAAVYTCCIQHNHCVWERHWAEEWSCFSVSVLKWVYILAIWIIFLLSARVPPYKPILFLRLCMH